MLKTARWVVFPLALVLALAATGCALAPTTTPPEFNGPKASSRVRDGMRLDVQTDQATYFAGHAIKVRVALVNTSKKEITLSTPTSLLFDVVYQVPGEPTVRRWSDGQQFLQVITQHTVPVGGALSQAVEITVVRTGATALWARLEAVGFTLETDHVTIQVQ